MGNVKSSSHGGNWLAWFSHLFGGYFRKRIGPMHHHTFTDTGCQSVELEFSPGGRYQVQKVWFDIEQPSDPGMQVRFSITRLKLRDYLRKYYTSAMYDYVFCD